MWLMGDFSEVYGVIVYTVLAENTMVFMVGFLLFSCFNTQSCDSVTWYITPYVITIYYCAINDVKNVMILTKVCE